MKIFKIFSDKYNKNKVAKKASELDIEKLESELNVILPKEYKKFIRNFGDLWTPGILDLIVDEELDLNDIQNFWKVEKIIFDKKNEWTSQIKPDLILFGSDCMGSIFGFLSSVLKENKESCAVYFFDHDFDTVEKVSDSFSDWINKFNQI